MKSAWNFKVNKRGLFPLCQVFTKAEDMHVVKNNLL